jgi:hypothetical protein
MNEPFDLPVMYNNKEILLPAQLHQYGYSFKIEVEVNGTPVFFERDEDRNWRALIDPSTGDINSALTTELLQAISNSIQLLLQ